MTALTHNSDVLGLILGGGRGTRLYPLTEKRAKPAVPLAGKYRLIDIPISNCIHAGINKIAVLTQFQSASLHRHILRTYRRDIFTDGWVEILAAVQSPIHGGWYQGTADAVRQQWVEIKNARTPYVLILAGDHLYDMDYRDFISFHIDHEADLTIAVQPVSREDAPSFGILKRDSEGAIVSFTEKPPLNALDGLESLSDSARPYLGSMGIYVISTTLLGKLLEEPGDDFGKHIVPSAVRNRRVMGYLYDGYWADIGTIQRFYEVNIELTRPDRPFDLFNPAKPIYTRPRFLPPSEIRGSQLNDVIVADGCHIQNAIIDESVIGLRTMIFSEAVVRSSVVMGADFYETAAQRRENVELGRPHQGIGEGAVLEKCIIDKNARIGRRVHIRAIENRPDADSEDWVARDGIVIVPKGATIPDGTVV